MIAAATGIAPNELLDTPLPIFNAIVRAVRQRR